MGVIALAFVALGQCDLNGRFNLCERAWHSGTCVFFARLRWKWVVCASLDPLPSLRDLACRVGRHGRRFSRLQRHDVCPYFWHPDHGLFLLSVGSRSLSGRFLRMVTKVATTMYGALTGSPSSPCWPARSSTWCSTTRSLESTHAWIEVINPSLGAMTCSALHLYRRHAGHLTRGRRPDPVPAMERRPVDPPQYLAPS